jgi:hypothetical protein
MLATRQRSHSAGGQADEASVIGQFFMAERRSDSESIEACQLIGSAISRDAAHTRVMPCEEEAHTMAKPSSQTTNHTPKISPVPKKLYAYGTLGDFGLLQGGLPDRHFDIKWMRAKLSTANRDREPEPSEDALQVSSAERPIPNSFT